MAVRAQKAVVLLVLVAFFLRWPGVFQNDFRPDEALFATFARLIGTGRDWLLRTQVVDKPPLLFYLQALFYPLLQTPAGWVARLPNLISSVLLIPLTANLTWRLSRSNTAAIGASALVAASPLAVQFAATAFTDPLLVTLLIAAIAAIVARRPGAAGALFGLALTTKYQALLFLPLLAGMCWLHGWHRPAWRRTVLGVLPPVLLLLVWEWARTGRFLLWTNQISNFGGLRLIWSWELLPRLRSWAALASYLFGAVPAILLAAGILWVTVRRRTRLPAWACLGLLYVTSYAAFHWLIAIPAWDRYLLPLLPLLAVAGGTLADQLLAEFRRRTASRVSTRQSGAVLSILLAFAMGPPAVRAAQGAYPIGAWPGADGGAQALAPQLSDADWGTVLYDHWYSWQWRFYYLDGPVFVSWFPHADALTDDLAVHGHDGTARYIVLPTDLRADPIRRSIDAAGFDLRVVQSAGEMTLYRLHLR